MEPEVEKSVDDLRIKYKDKSVMSTSKIDWWNGDAEFGIDALQKLVTCMYLAFTLVKSRQQGLD